MRAPIAPAALLLLVPGMAPADTPKPILEPIVVTATRTARTADETLASVTVITREDIERRQARTVPGLLRGETGLSVVNTGGRGKVSTVLLRGANADQVLVLIDGVRVGSATAGITAIQDLPIDLIERVEIVRGPRSSLYGSEAVGGVIQIFTRRGGGAVGHHLSLGAGSHRTVEGALGVSGGGERSWFDASLSGADTRGFDACRGEAAAAFAGCFTDEPDRDGYRNLSGSLRAGGRLADRVEVDLRWLRTRAESAFDGGFVNETDVVQQLLGGTVRVRPSAGWDVQLTAGRYWDESDNLKDGVLGSRFDTRRDHLTWQNDLLLGDRHLLVLGVDHQRDRVDSTLPFTVTARDNSGVFGQYLGALAGHDVELALRHDDNRQFGGHTTGSAAWGYALPGQLRLTASYGTAFKAPSFNDLYFPGFGNPGLRPEESRTVEVGLSGGLDRARWSLNAYRTRIDDLIAFDALTNAPGNVSEAVIRGLEAIASVRFAAWVLEGNLTWLDPENRSAGPNRGNRLPRRPEQSLRLDLDRDYGRYRLGATLLAAGGRYDDLANRQPLGGYATVDLRAEHEIDRNWRVQARLENVLDKRYETAAFFNQPGRGAYLTVRYDSR